MIPSAADYTSKRTGIQFLGQKQTDTQMNCFTCSNEENYFISPGDKYNEKVNNWQGPIHNGQFHSQTLKEMINTKETYTKYVGSDKFNCIPREVEPVIHINSYKDQCREHMVSNVIWYVFSLPEPQNKYKK